MDHIHMSGYCNDERIAAISEIEKIVNQYGFIINFHPFSDISISLEIELPELNIDKLYDALQNYMSMDEYNKIHSDSHTERTIFLNVSFIKGTGNLKIEVPAVPG